MISKKEIGLNIILTCPKFTNLSCNAENCNGFRSVLFNMMDRGQVVPKIAVQKSNETITFCYIKYTHNTDVEMIKEDDFYKKNFLVMYPKLRGSF